MLEGVVVPGSGAVLTAENEDNAWVEEFEGFGPLEGFVGVGFFGHLLYLPRTPGFVAEGPVFDLYRLLEERFWRWVIGTYIVGLLAAVLPAEVGVVRVSGAVAVFNPGQGWTVLVMLNLNA